MIGLASSMGVRATAFQTAMDRPLGGAAGHALEIVESIECLRGGGPEDLRELVTLQGGELLHLCHSASSAEDGARRIAAALDDGRALAVFRKTVAAQGGDPRAVDEPELLPRAPDVEIVRAARSGVFSYTDVRRLGLAICSLGGGRVQLGAAIDLAVGLVFLRRAGERVNQGDELMRIHHRGGHGLEVARAHCGAAFTLDGGSRTTPLVLARISA
jgi:thymidine phosphorylase